MNTIGSDIRFAVRSLSKSKLFTVVALLSLALGIGANVTVFTLVNAIAFKPLPFAEPDALGGFGARHVEWSLDVRAEGGE